MKNTFPGKVSLSVDSTPEYKSEVITTYFALFSLLQFS